MSDNRRVAIVGCGAIAPIHLAALKACGIIPVALCDTVEEKAISLAKRFDVSPRFYTDYSEMLRKEKLDVVHICTPHFLHAPMVVEALGKNIHVLCEKPLAISHEQLKEIKNAVLQSRASLGVCLQNRYEPNMLRLKNAVERYGVDTAFGDVVWSRDLAYYRSGAWRGKQATEGGGVMINQALHTLDLLAWLCGMPDFVTAHTHNDHLAGEIEVEDTATARFTDKNGKVLFQIFATTASGADFPAHIRLKLKTGAVLHADTTFFAQSDEIEIDNPPYEGKLVWGQGHERLIKDYYDCLGAGKPFPIGFDEGARVIKLILGMYTSDGSPVGLGKEESS